MFIFFITMFTFLNILMTIMNYPMMLMITLILQTINIAIMIGLINKSFWMSYILFLIIIGGLMILFMYLTSLMSNNMINLKMTYWIKMMTMFILIISLLTIMFNQQLQDLMNLSFMKTLMNFNNNNSFTKLYDNTKLIILMMNYLFFCLIVVTKIINLNSGPLRTI
uniref:NADH dehydrogenase subunit 6 n=1 Tax=Triaenodes qinglingensis TaxID=2904906 RepID=A0A9E8RTB7_9NEOP|nr:NADH dehydrogenase subunit 6 [Triaenodes qinglingensis]UZZ44439.1 NADH dehydrogenase subunit 6 [Triaenodes qinglingensis]